MKGLTARQREILNYINDYISQNGYSPSYRDITDHFDFSSVGTVYGHLKALRRKGALINEEGCARSISVVDEYCQHKHSNSEKGCYELPFIGYISANEPIETISSPTNISVPSNIVKSINQCYVFQVRGEGFIYDSINDGDLVIIEAIQEPSPGDIVLATIHKDETILKRYYPEGYYARFEAPSNNSYPITIKMDEANIQGKLISLFRLYS